MPFDSLSYNIYMYTIIMPTVRQTLQPRVNRHDGSPVNATSHPFIVFVLYPRFAVLFPCYAPHCLNLLLTASTKMPVATAIYINSPHCRGKLPIDLSQNQKFSSFVQKPFVCVFRSLLPSPSSSLPVCTVIIAAIYTLLLVYIYG